MREPEYDVYLGGLPEGTGKSQVETPLLTFSTRLSISRTAPAAQRRNRAGNDTLIRGLSLAG